jgi:hypothetical protein
MDPRDDGEISKRPPGELQMRQTTDPISSLFEAWLHTLDQCVSESPINDVMLPLLRDCFLAERSTPFCCCKRVVVTSSLATLPATLHKSRRYHRNAQLHDELTDTVGALICVCQRGRDTGLKGDGDFAAGYCAKHSSFRSSNAP